MESSISDSGVYTCDIGDLNSSCKLEVYGKTKTLQGQSHSVREGLRLDTFFVFHISEQK